MPWADWPMCNPLPPRESPRPAQGGQQAAEGGLSPLSPCPRKAPGGPKVPLEYRTGGHVGGKNNDNGGIWDRFATTYREFRDVFPDSFHTVEDGHFDQAGIESQKSINRVFRASVCFCSGISDFEALHTVTGRDSVDVDVDASVFGGECEGKPGVGESS